MTRIAVLTGGVGGAKLALGLAHAAPDADIAAIVNTGDDFRHFGLYVAPDLDTLLYTLAGKANPEQGWGRAGESWSFMAALRSLGGADWFQLGDGDLALHVLRSARLAEGWSLSRISADFAAAWGVRMALLPMSDAPAPTIVDTAEGPLAFQRYFVERRCAPAATGFVYGGAGVAPAPGVVAAIMDADAVLIAPSNPYLSIDPILAIPAIAAALRDTRAPVAAVSPLVGGKAVKGPTAKLMQEQGAAVNNAAIAAHYAPFLDGLLVDEADDAPAGVACARTATLMTSLEDRVRVARAALELALSLR